jgi:polysaccharide export outer membrane protein
MIRSQTVRLAAVAVAVFFWGGGRGAPGQAPPPNAESRAKNERPEGPPSAGVGARDVVIGPEDVLSIYVLDAEELTRSWRVNSTGELNLPLVGRVQAAGLTVEEFERQLTEKLKAKIRFPQVFVSVTEIRSQPVTVVGAVGRAGTLQLTGKRTLLQVLMEAGGPHEAGPTLTLTRRKEYGPLPLAGARPAEDGKYTVLELDLEQVMEGRSEASNLVVQPYDLITVSPRPKLQKLVHIIGEVQKPGAIELVQQKSVTVMQVLAAAGGMTRYASPGKGMIMHVNPEGVRTEIAMVDLKKIADGKVKDLELVAGDIVVVPTSKWRTYLDVSSRSVAGGTWFILARF